MRVIQLGATESILYPVKVNLTLASLLLERNDRGILDRVGS
jgi:hypothetical protein